MAISPYLYALTYLDINAVKVNRADAQSAKSSFTSWARRLGTARDLKTNSGTVRVYQFFGKLYT